MRKPVDTKLPKTAAPIEWATIGGDTLYTVQIPIRSDGTIEDGDIAAQTRLVFANLKQTVEAAGVTLDHISQILIYLANKDDFAAMNNVYKTIFAPPYPNRSTIAADLMVKGAKIEIVAYATLKRN
jgi:2-iminobutanoate/2-iminopropanoate deaminase